MRGLLSNFDRWAGLIDQKPQGELAETILEESGYTDMWQKDRTAEAAGRLENLKELVRSMEEFPDLGAFLEHISLVIDVDNKDAGPRVSIMTLHAAKGLEFECVFLPGWEEGLFPHQRSLDESGRAGLEEERRLAYVGLTRAKRIAKIYSRQIAGFMGSGRRRFHRAFWTSFRPIMSKWWRRRRGLPMAAMRNRVSPIWTLIRRPTRRRAGSARSAALAVRARRRSKAVSMVQPLAAPQLKARRAPRAGR